MSIIKRTQAAEYLRVERIEECSDLEYDKRRTQYITMIAAMLLARKFKRLARFTEDHGMGTFGDFFKFSDPQTLQDFWDVICGEQANLHVKELATAFIDQSPLRGDVFCGEVCLYIGQFLCPLDRA